MRESSESRIALRDTDAGAFQLMLDFVYGGPVELNQEVGALLPFDRSLMVGWLVGCFFLDLHSSFFLKRRLTTWICPATPPRDRRLADLACWHPMQYHALHALRARSFVWLTRACGAPFVVVFMPSHTHSHTHTLKHTHT